MRRFLQAICGFVFLCAVASCATSPQIRQLSTRGSETSTEKPFPVPIVELRGSGTEIGRQHGQQLSSSIHLLHDKYLMVFVRNDSQRFLAMAAADVFETELSPAHRDEVAGLALGSGIDEEETMLGQCFLDITGMTACSTITLPASASSDHVARFGRNLDFASLNVADKYTTLFIVHPDGGRFAFAAVGWPGMIGVLSGMNEHGLSLANMEVTRFPRMPQAMPYTILYRSVLEQCRNVEEAVAFLKKTPIQTANNLMLMDAAGNRAVVELTPDAVHVRRGKPEAALISTNHQRDQDADQPGKCWRYDYLHDTAKSEFGRVDEKGVEKMLGHVGNRTTLQSMVFEPANRVIYLATGSEAARREFYRLDLKPYFETSKLLAAH
jgi:isopenicillin-N N-acyltransferase-like protein